MIDALYSYGWESMMSQKYGKEKLLKLCKKMTGHHHLHSRRFEPEFKK